MSTEPGGILIATGVVVDMSCSRISVSIRSLFGINSSMQGVITL